ncbi:aspartyl/asparaginyl beta-hydroxylase domain-containing protein [Streptacidiphilus anmyonensis]|uniref:aspartyl/asparaginyl beta-hydroxylase domain-containing protein n=1 Tax=Streptacidiphilus anmyonensis TaxID=405782 RepID=UPI0005A9B1D1|nr:aspartyl/asparaginyl beta-hydroxylase domain-containing protein [Streptacidiphilus anmyonensis]
MLTDSGTPGCPAAAVRLPATTDAARLVEELQLLTAERWRQQRVFGASLSSSPTDADWRILPLRSPDGSLERTDPGGPGTDDFADTTWMARVPYMRSLVRAIPVPVRAVRLMALGPAAASPTHSDLKYGPRWGLARIHIPVVTNPGALLDIQGNEYCWQPGEIWFGDFSRPHHIRNSGPETRVHMVVDCVVAPELTRYFPPAWQAYLGSEDVLNSRPEQPRLRPGGGEQVRHRFHVPTRFLDWREPAEMSIDTARPQTLVSVVERRESVQLVLPDQRKFGLIHVADREFRFAGWTQERTIVLPGPDVSADSVVLRARTGRLLYEVSVTAGFDRSPIPVA